MRQAITVDIDVIKLLISLKMLYKQNIFYNLGKKILEEQKKKVDSSLEKYKDEYGNFDANLIEKDWFPHIDADIFISHSHKDEQNVLIFAGMIRYFFNKTCFIDSCCWNYCDDLITDLEAFYYNQNNSKAAQYVQSHVHIILSTALSKMISNTECLMFFKTPESISLTDGIEDYTFSPWIYSELQTANIILDAYEQKHVLIEQSVENRNFSFKYNADNKRFLKMNTEQAKWWFTSRYEEGEELTKLYNLLGKITNLNNYKQRETPERYF